MPEMVPLRTSISESVSSSFGISGFATHAATPARQGKGPDQGQGSHRKTLNRAPGSQEYRRREGREGILHGTHKTVTWLGRRDQGSSSEEETGWCLARRPYSKF